MKAKPTLEKRFAKNTSLNSFQCFITVLNGFQCFNTVLNGFQCFTTVFDVFNRLSVFALFHRIFRFEQTIQAIEAF